MKRVCEQLVWTVALILPVAWSFGSLPVATRAISRATTSTTALGATVTAPSISRRTWLASSSLLFISSTAEASEFTPGGTLVDYTVGPQVGNAEASASRAPDNSNVLFAQDYYFKFGTAAPWIAPGSVDFPKTMPFTKSQQRYDALKKYRDRILIGLDTIVSLRNKSAADIADPTATDVYYLRPMGLLANSFLASENTGSTNELLLARWYINELYLLIGDLRKGADSKATNGSIAKAVNSYLTLMNRVITEKVGEKFTFI